MSLTIVIVYFGCLLQDWALEPSILHIEMGLKIIFLFNVSSGLTEIVNLYTPYKPQCEIRGLLTVARAVTFSLELVLTVILHKVVLLIYLR